MTKRTIVTLAVAGLAIAATSATAAPPGSVAPPTAPIPAAPPIPAAQPTPPAPPVQPDQSAEQSAPARYGTETIPTAEAFDRGLSCTLTDAGVSCYDSQSEAAAAATGTTRLGTTQTTVMRALASCAPAMALYDGTHFTGSTFYIGVQSAWINLTQYHFSNRASSWSTGCAGGYLANGEYGGGARIGMPAYRSAATMGTFNNLASSVYRCPC